MSESKIEWTGVSWNAVTGCTKISKECDFCYAKKETDRYMHNPKLPKYKMGFDVVVEHEYTLKEPYNWKKPTTVFVNSMSDLFHKDISLDFIKKMFKVMNDTPQHTYQILTKRHNILEEYSNELNWSDNIWMGVSIGTKIGERRLESLKKCGAKHKFLSIEPLLEELSYLNLEGIDWVIVGGESGDNSVREMKKDWVLKVKENCADYKVPFFFKQWGKKRNNPDKDDPTISPLHKHHSKGGCMLDGEIFLENPTVKNKTVEKLMLFEKEYLVMDSFYDLKTIWELKSFMPFMEEQLFNDLKDDIKKNGVIDPVLYITSPNGDKIVVEGHTRLEAAIKLRLKDVPLKELNESFNSIDEIKLWMVKHQVQRRNLSSIERIELAYKSKETIEKLAKNNLSKAGQGKSIDDSIDTHLEISKIAGVGRTSIVKYSSIINNSSNSAYEKLIKGELSLNSAYNILNKNPKKKSLTVIAKTESEDNLIIINDYQEGLEKIKLGAIDGLLVIKNNDQLKSLTRDQRKRFGVLSLTFDNVDKG
jgi:protein gp37